MKNNRITTDGNNNIIIQDVNSGSITINVNDLSNIDKELQKIDMTYNDLISLISSNSNILEKLLNKLEQFSEKQKNTTNIFKDNTFNNTTFN